MLGSLCVLYSDRLIRANKDMIEGGTAEDTLIRFSDMTGELNLFLHNCMLLEMKHPKDVKVDVRSARFTPGMST